LTSVPFQLPAAGMHDHAGRLGDDDEIVVLVEDVERNVLAFRRRVLRLRQIDLERVARANLLLRIGDNRPLGRDLSLLDQRLDAAAGEFLAKLCRHPRVETAFGMLIGRQDFHNAGCLFKGVVHDASSPKYFIEMGRHR
jgi:hypothetical protein